MAARGREKRPVVVTGMGNVLCYASMIIGVMGANSNYTSAEASGQLAAASAARRIRIGRIDAAVAGAITRAVEPVTAAMLRERAAETRRWPQGVPHRSGRGRRGHGAG